MRRVPLNIIGVRFRAGCRDRIRTYGKCWNQNPVPYRLATRQCLGCDGHRVHLTLGHRIQQSDQLLFAVAAIRRLQEPLQTRSG